MSTKSISEWQREIGDWGQRKGWDKPPLCQIKASECGEVIDPNVEAIGTKLMLVVTEVSEAMEALRDNKLAYYEKDGKPEGMVTELADTVIRVLHLADLLGLDLEDAIERKMAFNEKREYRHGGRKA